MRNREHQHEPLAIRVVEMVAKHIVALAESRRATNGVEGSFAAVEMSRLATHFISVVEYKS
jgi:hypothetical protein